MIRFFDFERFRNVGRYIYWWALVDYLKPRKLGAGPVQLYNQGQCARFSQKYIVLTSFKNLMGIEHSEIFSLPKHK